MLRVWNLVLIFTRLIRFSLQKNICYNSGTGRQGNEWSFFWISLLFLIKKTFIYLIFLSFSFCQFVDGNFPAHCKKSSFIYLGRKIGYYDRVEKVLYSFNAYLWSQFILKRIFLMKASFSSFILLSMRTHTENLQLSKIFGAVWTCCYFSIYCMLWLILLWFLQGEIGIHLVYCMIAPMIKQLSFY